MNTGRLSTRNVTRVYRSKFNTITKRFTSNIQPGFQQSTHKNIATQALTRYQASDILAGYLIFGAFGGALAGTYYAYNQTVREVGNNSSASHFMDGFVLYSFIFVPGAAVIGAFIGGITVPAYIVYKVRNSISSK